MRITQKIIEEQCFARFKEYMCIQDDVLCEHRENPYDPPDYFLKFKNGDSWGIEITELVNAKKNQEKNIPQEKFSLLKNLTRLAEEIFIKESDRNILANIYYMNEIKLSKASIEKVAKKISFELLNKTKYLHIPYNHELEIKGKFPEFIQKICVQAFKPSIVKSSWKITTTQCIDYPKDNLIKELIFRKESSIRNFKVSVDKKVLLIVSGTRIGSMFSQMTKKIQDLKTDYDKVYFINLFNETFIELK